MNALQLRTQCLGVITGLCLGWLGSSAAGAAEQTNVFALGRAAYAQQDFATAATHFGHLATNDPSAGAWQNLGNAEWQLNRTAAAILAWERAAWINPADARARNNLQFARDRAQLNSLDLTWGEIASTWLPAKWWAWLGCGSLWFAVSLAVLPTILRRRKTGAQQALMAVGLGIFLLSLPANYGAVTRIALGVILSAETPLRLSPTPTGEPITRMAAGEPGRILRRQGDFLLIQTHLAQGWVTRDEFARICPLPPR